MDTDEQPDPHPDRETPRRRGLLIGLAAAGLAVAAVLAFGVFGVQTLFIDDEVDEAGPTFRSGATPTTQPQGGTASSTETETETDAGEAPEAADAPTTTTPAVVEAGRGMFASGEHPGEGTAVVLTDGTQAFVRFEDDFATDNGPDLYAVAYVGGERVELGRLKGNRGAQNYELPSSVDPRSVEAVAVWCKRFDATFTTAEVT